MPNEEQKFSEALEQLIGKWKVALQRMVAVL
jgi:hypothetical protein